MRRILTIAIVVFFFPGTDSFSQSQYTRKFPNRYKLDLPIEWNRPKLIQTITDILPQTFEELKDKEFCTDCEAGYTVMLAVDSPYIISRNNINRGFDGKYRYRYTAQVVYSFRATLALFDSTGNQVIELVLVSQEDEHIKRKEATVRVEHSRQVIKDQDGRVIYTTNLTEPPITPISNNLFPTLYELIDIAEQNVYAIRDIIAKIRN